jgi:tetratricopeptide (TPR) repeat protein
VQYIQKPQEAEAQEMIFMAQKYFEQDSLRLALNGDGPNMGFIDIADEYGSTKAGNLANYYAGVCYLNMGDFENAIVYLDEFNGKDEILSVVAKGAIGDAFLELNQPEEALEYYTKASKVNKNEFVIPIYLQKAAQTAEILNDYNAALGFYKRIKNEFPESREASDIDKQIAYVEKKLNP